jgi:small-conductance mechanosensitive channel
MAVRRTLRVLLLASSLFVPAALAFAQSPATSPSASGESEEFFDSQMLVIDGRSLFRIHGIQGHPASSRVELIAGRIVGLASDPAFQTAMLDTTESTGWVWIIAGDRRVMRVLDADAELEGMDKRTLSHLYLTSISEAITRYRAVRSRDALVSGAWRAGVATVLAFIALYLLRLLQRTLRRWERVQATKVKGVSIKSFEVVRANHIWAALRTTLRLVFGLSAAVLLVVFLRYVLGLFPWTWTAANQLQGWLLAPLVYFGRGLLAMIPDLIFLVILWFATRYLLRVIRAFFDSVGTGAVELSGFYPEWAGPTYNLVRLAVIAFAAVLAYPHVPGANTDAFKGVSIFMGAVLSLGSTGVISNIVAGYTMVYRRAFREGDLIKIDDIVGFVTKIRLQVTHLRTPKNEEVVVPNSKILNSEVINFSTLAANDGLIVHTTVGIGYETPWRQVEAMLMEAAARTQGLLQEPRPFVRQRALGDFAVTYEINAYTRTPERLILLYSMLHSNILDVFNEHGVQIMTPAYEGDPEQPKVVPEERWHLPPAAPAGAAPAPGAPKA